MRTITAAVVAVLAGIAVLQAPAAEAAPAAGATPNGTAAAVTSAVSSKGATRPSAAFDPKRALITSAAVHPSSSQDAARQAVRPAVSPVRSTLASPDGGSLSFAVDGGVESAQGSAVTTPVPGPAGGYVRLHSLGAVARVDSQGRTVWQRDTTSLYRDWHLTWQYPGYVPTPQIPAGTDPADPFELATVLSGVVGDTHPLTVGDLNGDRTPDVAIAETVGVNLGAANCFLCAWPFSVPGSDLHLGTFVTVLDGRTGATLFSKLEPGFVTQLAVTGGRLIIGDETGDPARQGSVGQWRSTTTVTAWSLHGGAHRVWRYDTTAPWARLLGLQPVRSGIAVAWTDTPLGLGRPGPPDGHVVLLGANGELRWDRRTAGYPVLTSYDAARQELAVVAQTDPALGAGYTLAGLELGNGQTVASTAVSGVLPTAISAGADWVVAGVVTTAAQVQPPFYEYSAGQADAFVPGHGLAWSRTLAADPYHLPQPGSVQQLAGRVVVGSWTGATRPTPDQPIEQIVDLQAFSAPAGTALWRLTGNVAEPLSLNTGRPGMLRGITQDQDAVGYDPATGQLRERRPILARLHAAVTVAGEVVAGGDSGAVYAWPDRELNDKPRWEADLGGPVHQLATAAIGGAPVVIAAATTELAIINARSGAVLHRIPGRYVWNVAVGDGAVVTGTDSLAAYDLRTGRPLWTFNPGGYFSNPVVMNDVAIATYGTSAVGVNVKTGRRVWTAKASAADATAAQLINGVAADGTNVAVTWSDSNGQGTVDVLDPDTGALRYANTDDNLAGHQAYVADPSVGLVSVGQSGSVLIRPSGPVSSYLGGSGAGVARVAGTPMFLTADAAVLAYPISALSDNGSAVAEDQTYLPGQIVVVPQSSGTDEILTLPVDWLNTEVIANELGQFRFPYAVAVQQGLARLHLTQAPATPVVRRSQAPARPAPTAVAVSPQHAGAAQPMAMLKVLGRDSAGKPTLATNAPPGYGPAIIAKYLGLHGDGTGQTIAVVDAYHDPNIAADVASFSQQFGLPPADLTITAPDGTAGTDSGWALETSLDVEWIHAVVPRAHIVLVEAHDGYFSSMFAAVSAAAALHPDAISMSWGIDTEFSDEGYYDHFCVLTSSICVASSGDYGYPGSYPAYNPQTLAVGGTTLRLAADGTVTSEQAWSGSGGGRSYFEPQPAYQTSVGRGIPDVSFDADPNTGVAVYDSTGYAGQSGWFQVGGTSLGAPVWAAILASADQQRAAGGQPPLVAGTAQRAIYGATSGLADITSGPHNGACPDICQPGTGYDYVTGLGSPRAGIDSALLDGSSQLRGR